MTILTRDMTAPPPDPPSTFNDEDGCYGLWIVASPDASLVRGRIDLSQPRRIKIGRSRNATQRIDDRWLSQVHVELVGVAADDGEVHWKVRDLKTKNGSRLNRAAFTTRPLLPGDVLRAGATVMVADVGAPEDDDFGLVGDSAALREVRRLVRRYAPGGEPVHITGESGAGKELVARAIHASSGRAGNLVAFNMANIVPLLAESQLFGHTKGAFSGADAAQPGLIVEAEGGTLFLDEIGELAVELQAKLLRAVEYGEVHPVGASAPRKVDTRLLTATNRDLAEMVERADFRDDLYWRLCPHEIKVPPLRSRPLDIVPVLHHFLGGVEAPDLRRLQVEHGEAAWHIADVVEFLVTYDWPGNVRQLRHEAGRLAHELRDREKQGRASPIPSPKSLLPEKILGHDPTTRDTILADSGPSMATSGPETAIEEDAATALLADPDRLLLSIVKECGRNIRVMVRRLAPPLKRSEASVRREIYRRLGSDRLRQLRARAPAETPPGLASVTPAPDEPPRPGQSGESPAASAPDHPID